MNTLGYLITLFFIGLLHLMLKTFNEMTHSHQEKYQNKFNTVPRSAGNTGAKMDYAGYNAYEKVDFASIEDEDEYDADDDVFDLAREDLLKWMSSDSNIYNVESTSAAKDTGRDSNLMINTRIAEPPRRGGTEIGTKIQDISMDSQYRLLNEDQKGSTGVKTFKPDLWTYENEKVMNGGVWDKENGIVPFDSQAEMNYSVVQ